MKNDRQNRRFCEYVCVCVNASINQWKWKYSHVKKKAHLILILRFSVSHLNKKVFWTFAGLKIRYIEPLLDNDMSLYRSSVKKNSKCIFKLSYVLRS